MKNTNAANKIYVVPTCSDDGKRRNMFGEKLYLKYKNIESDEGNITCYAAHQSVPKFNERIGNIDDAIRYREVFKNTCINPRFQDAGHAKRIDMLKKQRKNCEKKIYEERKRQIQEVNRDIVNLYIANDRVDHIGFDLTVENIDHATVSKLFLYLKNKKLLKEDVKNVRQFGKRIHAINNYSNKVIMIGEVPVLVKSDSPIVQSTIRKFQNATTNSRNLTRNKSNSPGKTNNKSKKINKTVKL